MFTPLVRLLLGIAGLVLAFNYYQRESKTALYLTLLAVVLVIWGYFKNGTVYLAWKRVKKQDFAGAESILRQTRFPEYLKKEQRGFYHFTLGYVEANKDNKEEAYKHFRNALTFGVRTENNIAIINLNLAEIEVERGNLDQAKAHMQMTRSLKHSADLEPEIEKVDAKINTAAQQNL